MHQRIEYLSKKKIKPLRGEDLNIYQTSGERRLVERRSIRKDHKERDGQNGVLRNVAHLRLHEKGEGRRQNRQANASDPGLSARTHVWKEARELPGPD